MLSRRAISVLGSVWVMIPAIGCAFLDPAGWQGPGKPRPGTDAKPAAPEPVISAPVFRLPTSAELAPAGPAWTCQTGTVGSMAYLQGARPMRVGGYALVVGLAGGGSSRCPRSVSDYLEKELRRMAPAELGEYAGMSPGDLIRSTDSAVVLAEAQIPTAAVKGSTFDIFVRSLDRDVKSLAGGLMLPCNLRVYLSQETLLDGRILAKASGRVFANPFTRASGDTGGDSEPGRGRVLGGGRTTQDRRIQIIMTTPSYPIVQSVSRILNDRFGASPKTADPISPTNIRLTVPRVYHGRETQFLDLVLHLPTIDAAEMRELRAKALSDELMRPDAPYENTALCLEALGQPAIPLVRRLYAHRQRATSLYAARIGARLGDELAVEALRRHAEEREGRYRQAAIRELGDTPAHRTGSAVSRVLRTLVADADPRVRIWVYEALRRQGDAAVTSIRVGRDNFMLDLVSCDGPPLLYARRTQERRIALLGPSLRCRPPLLYSHPGRPVTISARKGEDQISLVRKLDDRGRIWDPIHVSCAVEEVIRTLGGDAVRRDDGRPEALAIDYAVVLDVLSEFCRDGAIAADFRMEQPSVADMLGPAEPMVRPESDEL